MSFLTKIFTKTVTVPVTEPVLKPTAAITSTKKNSSKMIYAKISSEFKDQNRKDIAAWRNALEMAQHIETPNRVALHDLYDDLMTDGHLSSQINIRKSATLSRKFMIIDKATGKENIEKTELLKTKWFNSLMNFILDAVFHGFTIAEIVNTKDIEFKRIPYRNIVPEKAMILFEVFGDTGVNFMQDSLKNYLLMAGETEDFGILNNIIPQLIWKRNAQQSWAEYAEKFGIPMITATTIKTDPKELDRLEDMLSQLGEAAQAVLPEGTSIDIKDTADKGNYEIFDKQIERTNSEISKQILGGTMVSDSGSSRSQSEVHERTLNDKLAREDSVKVEFAVNNQLLKMLTFFGFPFTDNDKFVFDNTRVIDYETHWNVVQKAMESFEIPAEWISKTFNIPITGVKKKADTEMKITNTLENRYGISANFITAEGNNPVFNVLKETNNTILERLWEGKDTVNEQAQNIITEGEYLRTGLYEKWSDRLLKIDYNAPDYTALAFMEYNLFQFSAAKELYKNQQLNDLLINKDTLNIRTFADFKELATPMLKKVDLNYLRTEYNHAIAVGQSASAFNTHWEEKDSVTKFIQYQTIGDSNVRHDHAKLDGKVFRIEDKEARTLYAPNGWGCRCEMIQHLGSGKDAITGKEGIDILQLNEKKGGTQFLINRGELKQVFTANEMYVKNTEGDFEKQINKLDYSNFGKNKFAEMAGLPTLNLDSTITKENISELFKPYKNNDYMGFEDYLNRKMKLTKANFTKHTSGKYLGENENRHQMFPFVKEVLKNPDEVYMRKEKDKIQYRYVKFHKDMMFIVDTDAGKDLVIRTWYQNKVGDKLRKGLLIK